VKDRDEEPVPVAGDPAAQERAGIARAGVDDRIGGRGRAHPVEADLLVSGPVGGGDLRVGRKPGVVEARRVRRPGGLGVLGPLDPVHRRPGPGGHVHQLQHRLVRVVLLHLEGERPPVPGRRPPAQRGAPVLRPAVRVEEHLLGPGPLPPVEQRLLLRRGAALVEEALAALHRKSNHLLDVEQLLEPLGDGAPLRQGGEEVAGELVLGRHPGLGALRLHVLQPAVGVGDRDAVDHVHDLLAGRGGVGEGSLHRGSRRGGASGGGGAGGEEGGGDGRELGREAGHGPET
jgi:hypothetical protein